MVPLGRIKGPHSAAVHIEILYCIVYTVASKLSIYDTFGNRHFFKH